MPAHPGREERPAGWLTPRASDARCPGAATQKDPAEGGTNTLTSQSKSWPTPTAKMAEGSQTHRSGSRADEKLIGWTALSVSQALFPTPTAATYGSSQNGINGKGGANERPSANTPSLDTLARSGSLPCLGTSMPGARTCACGRRLSRVLNPAFVAALMGFPSDWCAIE